MEYSSVLTSYFIVIPIVQKCVPKEKNQTQQLETAFISANGGPAEAHVGNDGPSPDFLCDEQENGIENKNIQSMLWQKL